MTVSNFYNTGLRYVIRILVFIGPLLRLLINVSINSALIALILEFSYDWPSWNVAVRNPINTLHM